MKKMKKLLLALLSVTCIGIATAGFAGCVGGSSSTQGEQAPKTDEEKITATIDKFEKEYNDGNFDGVLDCFEPKTRNALKGLFHLLESVAGGKLGVDISLSDLFSIGVAVEDGAFIDFEIQNIAVNGKKATVTTYMKLAPAIKETMYIILVDEGDEWLIEDITDRQSSIGGGQGNTGNSGNVGAPESYCYISTDSYTDEYGVAGTYTEYNDEKFVVGTEVSLEATVNDGYNFEGWFVNGTCVSTDLVYEFEAKNDLWVVAEYSYYTVSTWGDGDDYETAGTYTKMEDQKVSAGEQVTLTATVNEGYNFEGWYDYMEDVCFSKELTYTFTMGKENKDFKAKYSYYVVNTWADGDDYGMAGTYTKIEDEKVSAGEQVTLTATVKSGYRFLGWYRYDVCMTKNLKYTFTMEKEDVELKAVFEKIE